MKFQLSILKTVRMHAKSTFHEWLTLYFQAPWGSVELISHLRPVQWRIWWACEVSALYLENCVNACWFNVFWVINPLFPSPLKKRKIVNPSTTCLTWSLTYLWSFSSSILKTVRMHAEFTFFEWLTLYLKAPWGGVELISHLRPVPRSHWRTCKDSALYLEN